MICELCGKEIQFLKPLLIEGSLLKVCPECAKFGSAPPKAPDTVGTSSSTSNNDRRTFSSGGFTPEAPSKEEVIRRRLEFRERRMTTKDVYDLGGVKELVEDYHKRIQRGRDKLGWNQEQLGQKINERKSVISKLENRSMKPDDKLVRKLEKALEITLMEAMEE